MIKELRFAFRNLTRSPGFTLVAIVTLTLAIGATTALFSLIKGAYFEGLPYPQPRELLTLSAEFEKMGKAETPISGPEFLALQEQSHTLTSVTALVGTSFNLTGEGDAVRFRGLRATASLFDMLRVRPFLGRVFTKEEQREGNDRVAVISYRLWQRALGGAPNVIGRQLQLNDVAYTILGVMPPRFLYGDNDVWVPLSLDLSRQARAVRNIYCHARLAPNTTVESVNGELTAIAHRIEQDFGGTNPEYAGWRLKTKPLIDDVLRDVKSALGVLIGAVGCILLIACANISNLQLARNVVREREMAIRLALGARRSDIIRQLMFESGLLAFFGALAGILLAMWSIGPLLRLVPFSYIPIEAEVKVDQPVLLATLGVTLFTVLLFGLLPAWRAARPALNTSLKDGRRSGGDAIRHRHAQRLLVISQVALTFVLLIASALMVKSFARVQGIDPGFDPTDVFKLEMVLPVSRYSAASAVRSFYETLLSKVKNIPGVQSAGAATILPLALFPDNGPLSIEGLSNDELGGIPFAEQRQVTPGYLATLNISLLRGRDFSERDNAAASPVAIVNQALVEKYFAKTDPIGRRIRLEPGGNENSWLTIIGVVKDVHQLRMTDPVLPEIYRSHAQALDASRRLALVLRSSLEQKSLIRSVRDLVRVQDPGVAIFDAEPIQQFIARSFGAQKLAASLLATFGALALTLTIIGIYGVIAYFVAQRTGEIGIRMALGAQRYHILQLILGQGVSMVVIGLFIGIGGAFAATRVLHSLLFEVSSTDLLTYLVVALSLAIASLFACYFPARSAMRLDPIEALRSE